MAAGPRVPATRPRRGELQSGVPVFGKRLRSRNASHTVPPTWLKPGDIENENEEGSIVGLAAPDAHSLTRLCRTVSSPPGRTLNGCKRRLGKVFDLRASVPKVSGVPGRESAGQQSNGGEANVGESNGVAPGQTAGKSKPGIDVAQAGRDVAVRGRNRSLKGVKRRKRAFGKKSRMIANGQKKFRRTAICCNSLQINVVRCAPARRRPTWSKLVQANFFHRRGRSGGVESRQRRIFPSVYGRPCVAQMGTRRSRPGDETKRAADCSRRGNANTRTLRQRLGTDL